MVKKSFLNDFMNKFLFYKLKMIFYQYCRVKSMFSTFSIDSKLAI